MDSDASYVDRDFMFFQEPGGIHSVVVFHSFQGAYFFPNFTSLKLESVLQLIAWYSLLMNFLNGM